MKVYMCMRISYSIAKQQESKSNMTTMFETTRKQLAICDYRLVEVIHFKHSGVTVCQIWSDDGTPITETAIVPMKELGYHVTGASTADSGALVMHFETTVY